ncbi:serine/threonine-protein kinase [Mesoterricola sediminis]|uniref:Protein kinase domain-containing protein n=1 Tax=Mesoterricola sediminis TaxID=2927980 RepID=A0AA48H209_9BACT|nr:serine/threonine-protein kinase [Mesoterricola sediminis]BDU78540.1 hypothetical protein METESE_34980 [Mesoterricola sediminis]
MAPDQPVPGKGEPPRPPEPPGPGPAAGTGPWITDLASLTRTGEISERVLARIPWERMGGQAGSWLDPLFQGPAPIAELQGLGERYVNLQFLGEGSAGTVFKAFDTLLQRWVALKALKEGAGHALTEARAQAQVEHPNVCRVYEVGRGFIVMQLVEGPSLADLAPRMDLRAKVACLRDIALGVHAAHQRGLLHLDLKLGNILIQANEDGTFTPLLSDFGMVVRTSGEPPDVCPLGTPPYASPEQLAGDPARIGPPTDVYAIGMMAYVLLGGRTPFEAPDLETLLVAMVQAEPFPLERCAARLPKDLARLVHQCLRKDPAQRCASAAELAQEFDRFLRHLPLRVMGRSLVYRTLRCAQRNRFTTRAILAGAALLVLALGAGAWREARTAQRTDWDRHFQKRVEEARVGLERAYRRPPHDIRPELAQVRAIADEIQGELDRGGRLVAGPAHLALGQLALLREAQGPEVAAHFKAAWDAGFRTEGARTWYAYALLRAYREALDALHRSAGSNTAAGQETLRIRFLEPARQMLQGHRNSDQTRMAHLVDQVEMQVSERAAQAPAQPERAVEMAAAYRRQMPQDLEALLEELDARAFVVRHAISDEKPRRSLGELQAQWKLFRDLLDEGLTSAPSHPGLHARLAYACDLALDLPGLDPAPMKTLRVRARDSVEKGLAISPDDTRLGMLRIGCMVRDILEDAGPVEPLRAEIRRIGARPPGPWDEVLLAVFLYGPQGAWRDKDLMPLAREALACRQDWSRIPNARLYLLVLGQCLGFQGQDPGPILRTPGVGFEAWKPWTLAVMEADHRVQAGRGMDVDLERLEAARAQEFEKEPQPVRSKLQDALLRARARGSKADWNDLEQAFREAPERVKAQGQAVAAGDSWTQAGLLLGEHAPAAGQDPGVFLSPLAELARPDPSGDLITELRARILAGQVALAWARAGRGSAQKAREGIANLDAVLAHMKRRIPFADLLRASLTVQGPGPVAALRGELGLCLARELEGAARRRAAQESMRDLTRALHLCPDLQPRLAPLLREARRFQTPR